MTSNLSRLLADASGATVVEYGLIASIICVGLIGVLPDLFIGVNGLFTPIIDFFASR